MCIIGDAESFIYGLGMALLITGTIGDFISFIYGFCIISLIVRIIGAI